MYSFAGGLYVPSCVLVNTEVGLSYKGAGAICIYSLLLAPAHIQKKSGFERVLADAIFFVKTIAALIARSHRPNSVAYQVLWFPVTLLHGINETLILLTLDSAMQCLLSDSCLPLYLSIYPFRIICVNLSKFTFKGVNRANNLSIVFSN